MRRNSWIVLSFVAAWFAAPGAPGQPRRFDFGPDRMAVAEGYTPVAASDAYAKETGYGWVAEENAARFAYLADLSNPAQIEKDAKIEKTGEMFSKAYPGMMGAHPDGAEATVVFRFEFPTAVQTASVCDQHVVWLGKGNQMQLSASADGQRWTALYNHRGAGRIFEFEKDLT
ncbi:MAG: hypothetical protein FJ279_33790, partial [Planctomycetes bacterium]|nr:hypothetical protein [Planctomycetota bacterium]